MTNFKTVLSVVSAIAIIAISSTICSAGDYGDASDQGLVTQLTSRDNGMLIAFLDHGTMPDQGCDFSDRAALDPTLVGAKGLSVTLQMAAAAQWNTTFYVDGCINHMTGVDNDYTVQVTVPRLIHLVVKMN